ncbi:MAG: methyltransferase domain-containing protein [Candidatus Manganitrophus sp. SB1]|nr:methyltransferase domain-containing protein [Candidatus Manganitrophus morganii]
MMILVVALFSPLFLLFPEMLEKDSEYGRRVRNFILFAAVIKGFPVRLIDTVRCTKDGGRLRLDRSEEGVDSIAEGKLHCEKCGVVYKIQDGILEMLEDAAPLDERNQFEMATRDVEAHKRVESNEITALSEIDRMELPTTLGQLGKTDGRSLLEIGCGTGRYTRPLAERCNSLLAVDFSKESLLANARSLPEDRNVGFVRADAGNLKLKEESFDLAFSTAYSNLPSAQIRSRANESVSRALKLNGKYVVSTHHHDIREILRGVSTAEEYENGIFFQRFTRGSLRRELEKYFSAIEMKTVIIWVPYISRFKPGRVFFSRLAEKVPILNQLGGLLLATAVKDKSSS